MEREQVRGNVLEHPGAALSPTWLDPFSSCPSAEPGAQTHTQSLTLYFR